MESQSLFQYDETLGYTRRKEEAALERIKYPIRTPSFNSYFPRRHSSKRRFIVYLEPAPQSKLAASILEFYRLSRIKVGPNEAHLYHPHCSMTGFFTLASDDVDAVVGSVKRCLSGWLSPSTPFPSPTLGSLVAKDSGLQLKLQVPEYYHAMVNNLVDELAPLARLRPKSLDHISLAYLNKHVKTFRTFAPAEISALYEIARNINLAENTHLAWDIAFYEQLHNSQDLCHPHHFKEIARWPVSNPLIH
ncbi:hypothetical protein DSO57_1021191 [Entomophthora muscae]|uniref:Uncharacterized protein n=1 Tax=Entomophthora muscae TaxID=34485 RepID=A0ACC2U2J7_9FUNG|nr:hypothetical protein DSO57_1021191 [Entomophthora muscae]